MWRGTQRIPYCMLAQPTACPSFLSWNLVPTSKFPSSNPRASQPWIQGSQGQLYWMEENPCLFQRETSPLLSPGCVRCKEDCCVPGSGTKGPQVCPRSQEQRGCRCVLELRVLRSSGAFRVEPQVNDRAWDSGASTRVTREFRTNSQVSDRSQDSRGYRCVLSLRCIQGKASGKWQALGWWGPWHVACYIPCMSVSNRPLPIFRRQAAQETGEKASDGVPRVCG